MAGNLRAKLCRLERSAAAACPPVRPPCRRCGSHADRAPMFVVVDAGGVAAFGACPSCGRPLGPGGEPLPGAVPAETATGRGRRSGSAAAPKAYTAAFSPLTL